MLLTQEHRCSCVQSIAHVLRPRGTNAWRPCPGRSGPGPHARPRAHTHTYLTREPQPWPEVGIRELLEAGVHFGHQTRRWNPKMRRFIHGERGGIYIIDLLQTQRLLEQAQAVRRRAGPARRHRAVRRHQEAGPRRRQGRRRGGRHAVRQPSLARRAADELPDDQPAHPPPARPRALRDRGPARRCCRRASAWPPRPTSPSCAPTSAA